MSVTIMGQNFNPEKRTIKNNNIFLVTDGDGNIPTQNTSGFGLYTEDTRFLSRLELRINDTQPVVLSSSTEAGHSSVIISTNTHMKDPYNAELQIPQESVQIKRESIIYGAYFETITIGNYNLFDVGIKLELFFEADFMDIFEVRNISGIVKGTQKQPIYEDGELKFIYEDTTKAILTTDISFTEECPTIVEDGHVIYEFVLSPSQQKEIKYQIKLKSSASLQEKINAYDFEEAFDKAINDDKKWLNCTSNFLSNNEDFNEMIHRGHNDINMLRVRAHYGEYLAAGIPWYTTLFGRDCIIAARQSFLVSPNLAKNVLDTLAKFQGKEDNAWRDEEPGKIPHEIRFGELARANRIPHSPYYGTVDATPLWIMLLHDYFKWTNDRETLEKLWQAALDCNSWIDNYAFYNGFASYIKRSDEGLDNQCWKDSFDSNRHKNGELGEAPLAFIEVQGYIYAAKVKLADLAGYMGENSLKLKLLQEAQDFRDRFHKAFWMEGEQFYSLGLDKYGNQMQVISSNPGHLLETGLIDDYYAQLTAERLLQPDMFSGWGIRTLGENVLAYNPMSYHNGSVWPHDNSIIAYGCTKIGRQDLALRITTGLFEAARLMRYKRLPELFCGFPRKLRKLDPPVNYPVACVPQAWAAASIFLLMQSVLNIEPDAQNNELLINNSIIPHWLDYFRIDNLQIGKAQVDIEFRKTVRGLVIDVLEKRGKIDILIRK